MKFYFIAANALGAKSATVELTPYQVSLIRSALTDDGACKRRCGLVGIANDLQTLRDKLDYVVIESAKPFKVSL